MVVVHVAQHYTQVHAGTANCQLQGLWALHNVVGARLTMGDARVAAQLLGCEEALRGALASNDDAVVQLGTVVLGVVQCCK